MPRYILSSMIGLTLLIAVAVVGCSDSEQDSGQAVDSAPGASATVQTLQARLDARADEFAQTAPPDMIELFAAGLDSVRQYGVTDSALSFGDTTPMFGLPNVDGNFTQIRSVMEKGPVVLTFYRGGWCPYCNLQLLAYQDILPEIERLGAELVAISPQVPDSSIATAERDSLDYFVLSDVGNRVAEDMGLLYTLPTDLCRVYQERLNLSAYNADTSCRLPLAATYVIDRDGVIRWAFLNADYRKRAEPADIIQALRSLQEPSS